MPPAGRASAVAANKSPPRTASFVAQTAVCRNKNGKWSVALAMRGRCYARFSPADRRTEQSTLSPAL